GQDAPIIGCIQVVHRLTKIFVRIPEGDGTRIRNSQKKVGQIRADRRTVSTASSGCARECERTSWVLLEEIIELLLAQIAANGEIVAPPIAAGRAIKGVRLP